MYFTERVSGSEQTKWMVAIKNTLLIFYQAGYEKLSISIGFGLDGHFCDKLTLSRMSKVHIEWSSRMYIHTPFENDLLCLSVKVNTIYFKDICSP